MSKKQVKYMTVANASPGAGFASSFYSFTPRYEKRSYTTSLQMGKLRREASSFAVRHLHQRERRPCLEPADRRSLPTYTHPLQPQRRCGGRGFLFKKSKNNVAFPACKRAAGGARGEGDCGRGEVFVLRPEAPHPGANTRRAPGDSSSPDAANRAAPGRLPPPPPPQQPESHRQRRQTRLGVGAPSPPRESPTRGPFHGRKRGEAVPARRKRCPTSAPNPSRCCHTRPLPGDE